MLHELRELRQDIVDDFVSQVDERCDDSPTQSNCRFVDSENGPPSVEGCHHSSEPSGSLGDARHNPYAVSSDRAGDQFCSP